LAAEVWFVIEFGGVGEEEAGFEVPGVEDAVVCRGFVVEERNL